MVYNRRRGTAIVEFPEGILVVSQGSESFMLAGGGANKGESRRKAAMRELQEETGLEALDSKYLFSYKGRLHKDFKGRGSFRDNHKVFLVKTEGTPSPQREIKRIAFFKKGSDLKLVYSSKEIIESFLAMKKKEITRLRCSHCGPNLTIIDKSEPIQCKYCGTIYNSDIKVLSE
ncbi:MAG TPA: NUDIX hydrolase [Candidatus Acidoferrum sp.]|nr:NUDIX hydrolase [Candidatus Acidoferrum sp.]